MTDNQIHVRETAPGEIRCEAYQDPHRPHNSLLARFDRRGVWLYCNDCRLETGKRGKQHLVTWPRLFALFVGLGRHD